MLCVLLCLSALGLVVDAAPVSVTGNAEVDLTTCPITYFGQQYTSIDIEENESEILLSFTPEDLFLTGTKMGGFSYEILDGGDSSLSNILMEVQTQSSSLSNPAQCALKIYIPMAGGTVNFYFLNYGTQAVLYLSGEIDEGNMVMSFVKGVPLEYYSIPSGSFTYHMDLTGCRFGGSVYHPGDTFSSGCSLTECDSNGELESTNTCQAKESCTVLDTCAEIRTCSFVGSSFVDFNHQSSTVPDFCHYIFLESPDGFSVEGVFRARRLLNMSFVDEVYILTSTHSITISQGSIVTVDNVNVTDSLSSSATSFTDVDLYKLDHGIKAEYTDPNSVVTTVFYDGTLLSISHLAPDDNNRYLQGLCTRENENDLDDDKSLAGCDTVTPDEGLEPIDCGAVTERCANLLEPFNGYLDRTPFIKACAENTLCKYPDVDDLECHFVDAYIRANRLDVSAPGCDTSVCVNHQCAEHEYCAVRSNNKPACFCRRRDSALESYRENGQFGEQTMCNGDSASVTLYTCFLEEADIDPSSLHMNSSDCIGSYDAVARTLTFTFDLIHRCGGTIEQQGNQVIFSNRIHNTPDTVVTTDKLISLGVSCAYTPSGPSTASLRLRDSFVSMTYTSQSFNLTVEMGLFTDANFSSPVTNSTELTLNQEVFVELKAVGLDTSALALVIEECWATSEPDPNGANPYSLIENGCPDPAEESALILSNGESLTSSFEFRTFEYVLMPEADIYLHCNVTMCATSSGCVPNCGGPTMD